MTYTCPICGSKEFETKKGDYHFLPPKDIPGGEIIIQKTSWEECSSCGEKILSRNLLNNLNKIRYERLGLLTSKEIRDIRKNVGLTQNEMA